jgi:hypothetical protein
VNLYFSCLSWVGIWYVLVYGDFWVNVNNLAFYGYPLFYLLSSLFGPSYQFCFVTYLFSERAKLLFCNISIWKFWFWVLNSFDGIGKMSVLCWCLFRFFIWVLKHVDCDQRSLWNCEKRRGKNMYLYIGQNYTFCTKMLILWMILKYYDAFLYDKIAFAYLIYMFTQESYKQIKYLSTTMNQLKKGFESLK